MTSVTRTRADHARRRVGVTSTDPLVVVGAAGRMALVTLSPGCIPDVTPRESIR
jgi:hypothetical protein